MLKTVQEYYEYKAETENTFAPRFGELSLEEQKEWRIEYNDYKREFSDNAEG